MTIVVAFGQSIPTSITVVLNNTSMSPDLSRCITRSLSSGFIRPWMRSLRNPANGPALNSA